MGEDREDRLQIFHRPFGTAWQIDDERSVADARNDP